jgi:hypothetical protein
MIDYCHHSGRARRSERFESQAEPVMLDLILERRSRFDLRDPQPLVHLGVLDLGDEQSSLDLHSDE